MTKLFQKVEAILYLKAYNSSMIHYWTPKYYLVLKLFMDRWGWFFTLRNAIVVDFLKVSSCSFCVHL